VPQTEDRSVRAWNSCILQIFIKQSAELDFLSGIRICTDAIEFAPRRLDFIANGRPLGFNRRGSGRGWVAGICFPPASRDPRPSLRSRNACPLSKGSIGCHRYSIGKLVTKSVGEGIVCHSIECLAKRAIVSKHVLQKYPILLALRREFRAGDHCRARVLPSMIRQIDAVKRKLGERSLDIVLPSVDKFNCMSISQTFLLSRKSRTDFRPVNSAK